MDDSSIGVYRSSDSRLIGTYEYDLWGRPISVKEASSGIDTNGILKKNPFRYRGYYYDNETGFYYLNARYYDPAVRRFISADDVSYLGADETVTGFNLVLESEAFESLEVGKSTACDVREIDSEAEFNFLLSYGTYSYSLIMVI